MRPGAPKPPRGRATIAAVLLLSIVTSACRVAPVDASFDDATAAVRSRLAAWERFRRGCDWYFDAAEERPSSRPASGGRRELLASFDAGDGRFIYVAARRGHVVAVLLSSKLEPLDFASFLGTGDFRYGSDGVLVCREAGWSDVRRLTSVDGRLFAEKLEAEALEDGSFLREGAVAMAADPTDEDSWTVAPLDAATKETLDAALFCREHRAPDAADPVDDELTAYRRLPAALFHRRSDGASIYVKEEAGWNVAVAAVGPSLNIEDVRDYDAKCGFSIERTDRTLGVGIVFHEHPGTGMFSDTVKFFSVENRRLSVFNAGFVAVDSNGYPEDPSWYDREH